MRFWLPAAAMAQPSDLQVYIRLCLLGSLNNLQLSTQQKDILALGLTGTSYIINNQYILITLPTKKCRRVQSSCSSEV
jgi:hypothetical protein